MPTKKYGIKWVLDDAQAQAALRRGSAALKSLDSQALKAAGSIEKALAAAGRGFKPADTAAGYKAATAAADGHARAVGVAAKAGADASIAATRRVAAERSRLYTREEATARAHERETAARNRRMVADAELAERAKARAVSAHGVAGMHAVSGPQRTAVDEYSGVQFRAINNKLRGIYQPSDAERERISARVQMIDKAITAGSLAKATVLHRGTALHAYGLTAAPAVGDVLKDKGYLSTSARKDIAEGFAKDVMLTVHARKGTRAADVTHLTGGGEAEVLFARNQALKVKSVVTDAAGRHHVVAEAVRSAYEQQQRDDAARTLRLRRDAELTESQRVKAARAQADRAGGGAGRGAAAAAAAEGGKGPKVDIGLHKAQMQGIKFQDDRVKAAARAQADLDAYNRRQAAQSQAAVAGQQRAANQTANAWHGAYARMGEDQAKAAAKASRSAEKQAERDALAAEKRAARVSRQAESDALGPYGRLAKVRRGALSEEQLQAAAANKAHDVAHNKRINQILKEKYATADNFRESISSAMGLERAITGVGIAMAGLAAGRAFVDTFAGAMNEAKQSSIEMSRQLLDVESSLREIAAIKGKFAPDDAEVAHHMEVRRLSGLTHPEAVTYEAELQNVLGTVSKDKFPEAERSRLAVSGAQLAARTGGGEVAVKNRARMAGLVADFVKARAGDNKVHAEDVTAMADAIDVLNSMGAASQAVSTEQSAKLMTALTSEKMAGSFHDPRQAVALSTIASKFEPDSSAEAAMQAIRQARGFTKWRKMKGADAAQAETLKAAGIEETMDPAQSMRQLFKFAKKEMKPEEAFDAFMARRGFRDQTGNMRLKQFYEEWEKGNFDRVMGEAAKPIDAAAPARKFAAFRASDVGRDLMARAAEDAERVKQGRKVKELTLRTQEAAPAYVAAGGDTTAAGRLNAAITSGFGGFGLGEKIGLPRVDGRAAILEREAIKGMRQQAGLEPGLGLGRMGTAMLGAASSAPLLAPFAYHAATAAQYVSGENAAEARRLAAAIEANNKLVEENNRLMKQQQPVRQAPPPLPVGAPAGGPRR